MRYLKTTAKGGRGAFTLIELLTVIAIIAVLAAILFPVFARARDNARRASCTSNMKQLALGFMMYAQDYDGKFPRVEAYVSGNTWDDQIFPYVKSDQVYVCPSAYSENTRSYVMNIWVAGWMTYPTSVVPASALPVTMSLSGISKAANTVLLIEGYADKNSLDVYNKRSQWGSSVNRGGLIWAHRFGSPWGVYTGLSRDSAGMQRYGPGTGVHINDTFVTAYTDGHVKVVKAVKPPTDGSFLWSPY